MKISVITPSLNCRTYIEDAIKSVLQQDYPDFEHIIADGGSTDGTLDILKKYSHLKWITGPDLGQSDAMNKGFGLSAGDIIVYLNADDYFMPGAFSSVIPLFEQGAVFVMGKIKVEKKDRSLWINDARIRHEEMLRHWEPQAFCVNPVGYFYRREVQASVNGFNVNNHYTMDLEFLLNCSKKYSFTKLADDHVLGVFRNYENTKTDKARARFKHYWTETNFNFIDKFLEEMPEEFTLKFRKDRKEGYKVRKLDDLIRKSDYNSLVKSWYRLKFLFYKLKFSLR